MFEETLGVLEEGSEALGEILDVLVNVIEKVLV